jgi:hypothetical protein
MLAYRTRKDVTIGSEVFTIRKLSGSSLEKASAARRINSIREAAALGREALAAFKEASAARNREKPQEPTPEEKKRARYALYDRDSVLLSGIDAWTLKDEKGRLEHIAENVLDLPEEIAQELHEAIVDLSLGPIELAEVREAEGKGSGPSTDS